MTLLTAQRLSKFFGADEIFSDISLEIMPRGRIALVGPNGAGKTTLVQLLLRADSPTDGQITTARNLRMAFLPQRPELVGAHSLWQEQLNAFSDLRADEARLAELASAMADPDQHDAALSAYTTLSAEFEHRGGYTYENRIRMVLTGVGFTPEDYDTPLTHLSGGQKTRALLARLLLEEPDLLVLDEPTNHLDIQAVEWLENFLKDFSGAVLAVSHDRYFIDAFATTVWELEFGHLETYRGNYTHYQQQREERRERLQKEYEAQQAMIAKEQDYIRKHMGSRWTAQAKGRLKKLETMARRGKIIQRGPQDRRQMRIRMATANRSGDKVLMTRMLSVGYDEPLFTVPDVTVFRGETVAIIGPNGAGKSTLLKTLVGQLAPLGGESRLGAQVQIGYFAQAHEGLNPDDSLIDAIIRIKPMKQSEARDILGAFLFSGDDVFRPIHTLSGGERGRVALAQLALAGSNLLLLDEPTNHLDIDSQEVLQMVLEDFAGTILLVSHDRYLIDALATQVWEVSGDGVDFFDGTYQEYIAARNQRLLSQPAATSTQSNRKQTRYSEKVEGMSPYALKQRIAALETEISQVEDQLATITSEIEQASARGDAVRVAELGEQYARTEEVLEASMAEWSRLAELA